MAKTTKMDKKKLAKVKPAKAKVTKTKPVRAKASAAKPTKAKTSTTKTTKAKSAKVKAKTSATKAVEAKPTKVKPVKQDPVINPNTTLVTKEGLKKMLEELDDLRNRQLVEIAAKLKEAVSQGDLSENAEYAEAKEQQQMAILRIAELEEQIKRAEVIKRKTSSKGELRVSLGSLITVSNLSRNHKNETFTIVGSLEANPFENRVSNISPLGRELLGKKKNDEVTINVPAGEMTYKITKIA